MTFGVGIIMIVFVPVLTLEGLEGKPFKPMTLIIALLGSLVFALTLTPVLVTFIKQKLADGTPLEQAVREGCLVRLRPVLMTALVAAVGLIPMAVNVSVGGGKPRVVSPVGIQRTEAKKTRVWGQRNDDV